MSARSSRTWSPAVAFGVGSLYAIAFFFGGLRAGVSGLEYHLFGLVDGLAALLILYVLLNTAALSWPRDVWGGVLLIYAAASTAQLVSLLLPPPGLVQYLNYMLCPSPMRRTETFFIRQSVFLKCLFN